jgi:DNA-binding NarL/FixJ family response regulator
VLDSLTRGRQAVARRAWKDAYAWLSAADAEAALEDSDLELLATSAYLVGHDEASEAAWVRAYEHLRARDKRRAARCAFWLVLQLFAIGDWARGGGWLATAERLLQGEAECPEGALLLVLVARMHAKHGNADAAYDTFTRVADVASRSDDPELRAFALLGLAQASASRGDTAAAMALFDEAMVTVTTDSLSPISAGVVYCAVIEACYDVFDVARAREWTAALSRWCAPQSDLVPFRGHCLVHRAETLRLTGDWSSASVQAAQACAPVLDALEATSPPAADRRARAYPIGAAFYELGEIHRMCGRFDDAEEAYRQAHLYGRSPEPGVALLRLAQGRFEAAEAAIRRAHGQRQKRIVRASILAAYVDISIVAHDHAAARDAARELATLADVVSAPYLRALSAHVHGSILLAEGKPRDALDALRASWVEWQLLDVPYEAARVRVAMGESCRQLGDPEAAEREFDAARQVFVRLGAAPDVARVNGLLAPPSHAAQLLTPRELQVIKLIAAGDSNRRIAGALAISERTVDRHVSNILTKLDLPSRTAATAYAYEHGLVG